MLLVPSLCAGPNLPPLRYPIFPCRRKAQAPLLLSILYPLVRFGTILAALTPNLIRWPQSGMEEVLQAALEANSRGPNFLGDFLE